MENHIINEASFANNDVCLVFSRYEEKMRTHTDSANISGRSGMASTERFARTAAMTNAIANVPR